MVDTKPSNKSSTGTKKSVVELEHQFHRHHLTDDKALEYADEFQPVLTSNPDFINRGHSLDREMIFTTGGSKQQQQQQEEPAKQEKGQDVTISEQYGTVSVSAIPSPYMIPTAMKAVVAREVNKEQPWESLLFVHTYPTPTIHQIESDEVLVKLHAASVNPVDFKMHQFDITQLAFPYICGRDGAGEIVYMGDEAREELSKRGIGSLDVCDEVLGVTSHTKYGTYAQYAIFHHSNLARKPKSLTWEQAAALPVAALSIWKCLSKIPNSIKNPVQRQRPLRVLIHGGSGGTGSIAVLLAKHYFLADQVYATCSQKNAEYVRGLGADRVIDYENEDFETVIHQDWEEYQRQKATEQTFKGYVNVVIDTVGGYDLWNKSCEILDHESYLCSIAPPHELEEPANNTLLQLLKFGGTIVMEKVRHWTMDHPNFFWVVMDNDERSLEHVAEFLAGDHLIEKLNLTLYDLQDVRRAHEESHSHHAVGKIVLKIGHDND